MKGDLKTHKHTCTTETKRCRESITGWSQLITYIPVSLFKLIKFWYITLCIGRVLRWPPKFVVSREYNLYNPSHWVWPDMYLWGKIILKIQFSSVAQSCPTLRPHESQHARPPCPSPTPRVHSHSCPSSQWCHLAISSSVIPSPLAFNLSQHQGLFQWVGCSHQVDKVLELQLQHQPFQWIFRTDFL